MKSGECEFEAEVLAAVIESRWPGAVEAGLREHVAACPICSEVAAVAYEMQGAAAEFRASAVLPNPGRVWWAAELRARREAAEVAACPITAVQLIVFASIVGLLVASAGTISTWLQSSLSRMGAGLAGFDDRGLLSSASALLAQHGALAVTIAALIVVVPTAFYLAIARD
jgi:hypothetical protein